MSLQQKLNEARMAKVNAEKETGSSFMAENKKKEGVQELPGGVQYLILQEGNGPKPALSSRIKAHYAGRLLDGKEFDSSYRRNQPFTAPITSLIKGWQQALPLMATGSKWRLWIPSDLAYGDNGVGQAGIPGGATLEFDVELLEILS